MHPDFESFEPGMFIDGKPPVFWMVWNKSGTAPNRIYHSRASAVREADRLAQKHPADQFFILRAESVVETTLPPTTVTELVEAPF